MFSDYNIPSTRARSPVSRALCTASLAAALTVFTACGGDLDSGGNTGDSFDFDFEDLIILTNFAGVFDLTGNWSGSEGDAAMLVIRPPGSDGSAEVVLYDIDDRTGNCSERPIQGLITLNRLIDDPQIFLNDIFDFDNATVSLNINGSLNIEFSDVNDINNNGSTAERVSYLARPVAILEQDIPAQC